MPASPTGKRRGLPTWILVLGVSIVSAGAAVVAAALVIGIMFAFVGTPSEQTKKPEPVVLGKPDDAVEQKKDPPPKIEQEIPVIAPPIKVDEKPAPGNEDFVQLFNGRDLTGWKPEAEKVAWRVEGSHLSGIDKVSGGLVFEKQLAGDFHLRAELRVGDKGNVFFWFRSLPGEYGAAFKSLSTGLQAGNLQKKVGAKSTTTLPRLDDPRIKPGDWATLEIIAKGNHIVVKVNGVKTGEVMDAPIGVPNRLTLTRTISSIVDIRKIEIKEFGNFVVAPPVVPAPPILIPADGFVSLFNGKDLTGWKTHERQSGNWRVLDGVLIGDRRVSSLYTTRGDYTEFHLRAEARINNGGIGALFARATYGPITPSFGPKEPLGYKAIINNTAIGKKTGQFYTVRINSASHGGGDFAAPPGQWSLLEIIADGKRIRHLVDGKESQFFPETKLYPSGHIALHLDNSVGLLEFRRIEIKETAAPAAPKAQAFDSPPFPPDASFVPLFNNKDLSGWKLTDQPGNDWRVVNGVLTGTGKLRELYSTRDDFRDFHLRLEMRINEIGTSTLAFRYPNTEYQNEKKKSGGFVVRIPGRQDDYKMGSVIVHEPKGGRGQPLKEPLVAVGRWVNMEILAQGNHVITKLNGQEAANILSPDAPVKNGRFVFSVPPLYPLTVIEYRRIEIREFK